MPVRIYSLAKELNLDGNVLVDICNKAGVLGKASSLAGLTDEELAIVKNYLARRGANAAAARAAVAATVAAAAESRPLRREDYVSPAANVMGKPPVLVRPNERVKPARENSVDKTTMEKASQAGPAPKPSDEGPNETRRPVIRLARMPVVEQPVLPPVLGKTPTTQPEPNREASSASSRFGDPGESPSQASEEDVDLPTGARPTASAPTTAGSTTAKSSFGSVPEPIAASADTANSPQGRSGASTGKSKANRTRLARLHDLLQRRSHEYGTVNDYRIHATVVAAILLFISLKVFVFGDSRSGYLMAGVCALAFPCLALVLYSQWRKTRDMKQSKAEIIKLATECGLGIPELRDLIAENYPKLSAAWKNEGDTPSE